ncbi:MAG: NTP transferase domain-containing protein [Gemmatimonadota bacterium]|nr:NTP transferase domain-containing protein [Gemmatimonadota bacterium]
MVDKAVIIAAGMGSRLNGHGRGRPKPLVKVAGVGLLKRAILTAKRAGISEFAVVIGYRGDEIREAVANDPQIDVDIDWVENPDWRRGNGLSVLKARDYVDGAFLLLMADHLFEPRVITRMRRQLLGAGESALCIDTRLEGIQDLDDATKVVLEGDRIQKIGKALSKYDAVDTGIFLCSPALFDGLELAIAAGDDTLSGGVRIIASRGYMKAVDIEGLFWQDVDTPDALRHGESALFGRLGKPTDGIVSRNFNRKVSAWISRILVKTPVTPNQISIAAMLVTFLAGWAMADGSHLYVALGGLLFQFASIIDGCDGEIASLKFAGSRFGEWLDTVADNVSYLGFFSGVIYGMYKLTTEPVVIALGFIALALNVLAVLLICVYLKQSGSGSIVSFNMGFSSEVPEERRGYLHRIYCGLKFACRRDFFAALFCVLAVLNCLEAIFWIFVLGSGLVVSAVFGFIGHILRTRTTEAEKLVSGKAD